jgi:hypothetical protein
MKLLYVVCNTSREREEGHEICRQSGKGALYKGNLTTLRQVHYFSISQMMLYLFNDIIPNRLGLIGGPQQKTKTL